MALISGDKFEEGEIINKWLHSRLIENNKNVLTATTGPTGSGKSYQDLRKVELWYQYHFKKEFPAENICFSIGALMKRISSGELKKGEILIMEEAGANLGSLDFQNKVSKLFTYVLQTFRSMNVAIFFNLPYLSMLNKQARTLIHVHFETAGIDHESKLSKCKAFFRQVNQATGKVYNKHIRVKIRGKIVPIKRFKFAMPSKRLIDIYEQQKLKYVSEMTVDFSAELDKIEFDKQRKMARDDLTEKQREVYNYLVEGLNLTEIAKIRKISAESIRQIKLAILKKGFKIDVRQNTKEKQEKKSGNHTS